jgi:anti-anti-sigma factor
MGSVTVRISACGEYAVAALSGELDAEEAACTAAAVAAAGIRVLVDLSDLEYIDCCALSALLRVEQLARRAGGEVLLTAPRGLMRRVLELAGAAETAGVPGSVPGAAVSTG